MPTITETLDSGAELFDIDSDELAARLPDLGGHDVSLHRGAHGHISRRGDRTMITLNVSGPGDCRGCGSKLQLNPDLKLTEEQLMDPAAPLPAHVSRFNMTTRTFTVLEQCPAARPEHYSVEIDVPGGRLLLRNRLARDESSPLHYELEYEEGLDINSVLGRRHRTRQCAEKLGYGIVSTTDSPDIWRLADGSLQIGGPGMTDGDEYGRYGDDGWIPLERPGEHLGWMCLDIWSIEMMDLGLFTAAGGALDDQDPAYGQIVTEVVPGKYRLTVLNEAYEAHRLAGFHDEAEPAVTEPDATIARLERIG